MTWLDVLLVALLVASVYSGYRRGAVLQLMGIAGLAIGVVVGVMLAPRVAVLADSRPTAVAMVLGTALVAGAIGNMLGWLVGSRLRSRAQATPLRTADAVGGSVLSGVALLTATWLLALNLIEGPFPMIARGLRSSTIVRTLEATLPAPPSLVDRASELLPLFGLPDGSVDLPGRPAPPVDPPTDAQIAAASRAAQRSTIKVVGDGCAVGSVNQGSGFVVGPGIVLTSAHVVAGTQAQRVQIGDDSLAASVVAFDAELDIAALEVPGLELTPLRLLEDEAERGAVGAVLGFPGGGSLQSDAAAVLAVIEPLGPDIYGSGRVHRRIYELQTRIDRGNSGGPFVLASGGVAGLVFASSADRAGIGYAIVAAEMLPLVERARATDGPVDTGPCIT